MIIVVEGCDGTGKTTLVEKLRHAIEVHETKHQSTRSVRVIHSGPPSLPPLEEYEKSLRTYDPSGEHLILDRWHWGELIYGPIYRGATILGDAGLYHVDKYLDAVGAVMINLTNPLDVIEERLSSRGEDYLQPEHVAEVLRRFDEVFERSVLTEKHKLTDPTDTDVISAITLGYIREEYALQLEPFGTYVGPRFPKFLLLGEKRKDPTWKSAFVPNKATSGYFLLNALPRAVVRDSGLANACEENVQELYETLKAPKVVALGKLAEKAVEASGVPYFAVPHPQYIRRFHNSRQQEYGQVISRGLHGEEIPNWPS